LYRPDKQLTGDGKYKIEVSALNQITIIYTWQVSDVQYVLNLSIAYIIKYQLLIKFTSILINI